MWARVHETKLNQYSKDSAAASWLFTQGKGLLASKRHWNRVKGLIRGDRTQVQAWPHRPAGNENGSRTTAVGRGAWSAREWRREGKSRKKNEYEQKAWSCVKQEPRCRMKLHNVKGAQRWQSKKTWEVSPRVRPRKSTGATRGRPRVSC